MTNRALMDKSMSEEDFARAVVDLALSCGWKVKREPPWRAACRKHDSAVGFPDLVCLKGSRLVVAELKAEGGTMSPAQREWANRFETAAMYNDFVEYYIWRPSDWNDIEEVLD